jgi:hypothetical protein
VKRIWPPLLGVLGFLVLLPFAVFVGSQIGVPTVHWSGVEMANPTAFPFPWPHNVGLGTPDQAGPEYDRLESLTHSALEIDHPGLIGSGMSGARRQVILDTAALSHGLFADLGHQFGDDVVVNFKPFGGPAHLAGGTTANAGPSWWEFHQPVATWFVLVTGFPWCIAAAVLVELLVFLPPRRRRAPRRRIDHIATPDISARS